ncbi:baeRF2 domain-containing protein [Motilibacter deserti]|uniref:Peptide chain release factor 1 n=1 Tax=Motilibacter deserti TaxID=2714956 RepID=A0ABX0GR72_9ACTN|nr:Vms1/Ankzf1 family peptidyl-tRNA hydrolase [Motilibacter deserti]NHC13363.1 peptide chain release factor 1 [Motilibacter deserti]
MTRLSHLRDLYSAKGPFVTAYLDATRSTETGAHEVELRWRAQREQLAEAGAPDELLDALEPVATAPTGVPGDNTLVLVGAGTEVLFSSAVPGRIPERASYAPVPDLGPLALTLGQTLPYVLVHIDRTGADIDVVGPLGQSEQHTEVKGGEHHISKVHAGGWSYRRYEHRAENLWESNATDVAKQIDTILAETSIPLLAVTGDTRANELFQQHLGTRGKEAVVTLDSGGRAAGSDEQAVQEDVRQAIAAKVVRDTQDQVELFREQTGAGHGGALTGRAEVVGALQKAQVDTLIVTPDFDDDTTVYVGPDPSQIAVDEAELKAMGVDDGFAARADAALLRATIATDAHVIVVPKGRLQLQDGVGALLRYSDESTPSA